MSKMNQAYERGFADGRWDVMRFMPDHNSLKGIVEDVLRDRGNRVQDWPQDEQDFYHDNAHMSFTELDLALWSYRTSKVADAIMKALPKADG